MSETIIVWYLLLASYHSNVIVPDPYPAEQMCIDAGKIIYEETRIGLNFVCIPAYRQGPVQ